MRPVRPFFISTLDATATADSLRLRGQALSYRLALGSIQVRGSSIVQIVINGTPREVTDGITVAELLGRLELRSQQVAVEVNRELVPRTRHQAHVLLAGDAVEIVTLVGGG